MKRIKNILFLALSVLLVCACAGGKEQDRTVYVESVSLDIHSADILVGHQTTLTAQISPKNADNKTVGWVSSDPEVVSVAGNGLTATVTGVGAGTATITVTTQDGGFTDECTFSVTAERKSVRPSGEGWTKTAVMDGIDLYTFIGKDKYVKKAQSVYVADVDLAKYDLMFAYDGTRHITSDILKNNAGAVISMNGAYETSSIYIRIGGKAKHKVENDGISGDDKDHPVPNWKNDGAICKTTDGKICIINTIYREEDDQGSGSYGLTLSQQRSFYRSDEIKKYTDVFSSSPLMIDDFKPIGTTFLPVKYQSYSESALGKAFPDSEHPYHHQGYTHPRTAIALTFDNHLLMIVADGRFTKADGFSVHKLTSFLVDNFDPQYALNMDGGGSSTLCVAGLGDSKTHVVNHPYDNGKYDHEGERNVTSHFYVVKKNN